MRFSRICLENWRNFASVDVKVENRAFLVGQNASGKSNFLDALRFLRDIVSPGGGFQSAVNRRGGVSLLRNINARWPSLDIAVDVELSENDEVAWRYRLARKTPCFSGEM
jgi:predicted ATPase